MTFFQNPQPFDPSVAAPGDLLLFEEQFRAGTGANYALEPGLTGAIPGMQLPSSRFAAWSPGGTVLPGGGGMVDTLRQCGIFQAPLGAPGTGPCWGGLTARSARWAPSADGEFRAQLYTRVGALPVHDLESDAVTNPIYGGAIVSLASLTGIEDGAFLHIGLVQRDFGFGVCFSKWEGFDSYVEANEVSIPGRSDAWLRLDLEIEEGQALEARALWSTGFGWNRFGDEFLLEGSDFDSLTVGYGATGYALGEGDLENAVAVEFLRLLGPYPDASETTYAFYLGSNGGRNWP